jgi:hypothetical protein
MITGQTKYKAGPVTGLLIKHLSALIYWTRGRRIATPPQSLARRLIRFSLISNMLQAPGWSTPFIYIIRIGPQNAIPASQAMI